MNRSSVAKSEKHQAITEDESRIISLMQVLSILSVVAAHVTRLNNTSRLREIITSAWSAFGVVGVVVFLILGGFLYNRAEGDAKDFWRKKLRSLLAPWLICSLITYAVTVITTNQTSGMNYLKWFLGVGTWYYYATVYVFFLLIFKFLEKKEWILYITMAMTGVSLTISTFNENWLSSVFMTPYLNVFNWIGFFALGIIIRKYRLDKKILQTPGCLVGGLIISIVAFLIMYKFGKWGYFSILGLVFELASAIVLLYIAKVLLRFRGTQWFLRIGAYTYCIYLLHMPIVQPICSRLPDMLLVDVVRPLIALAIMVTLIDIGKKICHLLPFGQTICKLLGIRYR